jgi:hypothetical protein
MGCRDPHVRKRCKPNIRLFTVKGVGFDRRPTIPKYLCFYLQLSKAMLENIADADDPHELTAVLGRHPSRSVLTYLLFPRPTLETLAGAKEEAVAGKPSIEFSRSSGIGAPLSRIVCS